MRQRRTTGDDDGRVVRAHVARLRLRLGCERLLAYVLRGALVGAVLLIVEAVLLLAGSALPWSGAGPLDVTGLGSLGVVAGLRSWSVVLPLVVASVWAGVRWPSAAEAARVADQRLGLAERLATALELIDAGYAGRFDQLQVRDARLAAAHVRRGWLLLGPGIRRESLLLAGLALVAAGLVVVVPTPLPQASPTQGADADQSALAALPVPSSDVGQTQGASAAGVATQPQPVPSSPQQVQQAAAEQQALNQLSQALSSISAGQPAAEAIQQGDLSAARQQLQSLGEQADQLSASAKQQLARALQSAATATGATDPQLAQREQQAAQALSRTNYNDQRQALSQLADQIERSGSRSLPPDQLARALGQLEQQGDASAAAQAASGTQAGQTGMGQAGAGAGQQGGGQGQQGAGQPGARQGAGQSGTGQGAGQAGADGSGGSGGSGTGQQGGSGYGNGVDPNVLGDPNARLDAQSQRVDVPAQLGAGAGSRPPDASDTPAQARPGEGSGNVAELTQPQQTGQLAAEQNLVPGDQRPVVQGYFR